MLRVLYIARYHRTSMERKLELMADHPDLALWLIRPAFWQDEYGRVALPATPAKAYRVLPIPMLGQTNDPHRAFYRSPTFAMRTIRPDIIHAEEEPDSLAALQIVLACRLLAPAARLILHTWQNINRPKTWYVRWVTQTTLKRADAILCANREALVVLDQMGYARQKAVIPPQGVDLKTYQPVGSRSPHDVFTVAYVGRFVPEKGLDTLIEAVREIGPPLRLLLVGDGPTKLALEGRVRQLDLGDRVEFVAPMTSGRIAQLYGWIDALVLPSRTTPVWKEQFGRVLVEAMACKVPVIGSDSGAIPEVVGDAGLIFPEGDAKALAAYLRRLNESPDLRRELGEKGYARATTVYSQEHIADRTAEFYRMMME